MENVQPNMAAPDETYAHPQITVVNLMKHDCVIEIDGEQRTYPPSGKIAHVAEQNVVVNRVRLSDMWVPICSRRFGAVANLPPPTPGTIYLVSSFVLQACPDRKDIFAPDSGETAKRNEKGHVISVCRLIGNG